MKKTKRFISAICAGIVTVSTVYSSALASHSGQVFAASADSAADSRIVADKNDIVMEGTNSFGTLLADTLSEKQEEQNQNNGCNIFEVTVEGTTASVSFETSQDAALVVGIYTESGEEMLASGMAEITKGEKEAYIEIQTEQMPEYFLLRAFMADKETLAPLCSYYESPNYTKEMQEFFAKTTDDFEKEKVLNLDGDKTNNFAVYKDSIVQIQPQENINQIVSSDEENGIYVIENADETILSLQAGDIFSYQYGEGNLLIVKVKNISKDGKTVTITGEDTSLDEVFDYVKIDSSADMSKAEIDSSTCDEGVIYNGLTEWKEEDEIESYAMDIEESSGISASYTFKEKKLEAEGSAGSASVKVSGGVDLKIECSIKVYISFSYQSIEYKLDYSAKLKADVSGKATGKIKLGQVKFSPIVGIDIEFTPSFLAEANAKMSLSGELKGTIGFKADSETGGKNISSTPKFETKLKAEGKIFVGLSLEPKIKIIDEYIANADVEAVIGAEVSAKMSLIENTSSSKIHDCKQCLTGEIYGKLEAKFKTQIINSDKLKFEESFEKKSKIADFYYSFTFNEFGWETCPYVSYKTVVTVIDDKKELVSDATVNVAGNKYVTDQNGKAICYLPNGEYKLVVEKAGYNTEWQRVTIMDEGKEVEITITVVDLIEQTVSLGGDHSAAITKTGDLYIWGHNQYGQLGDGTKEDRHVPIKVMEKVKSVSLGENHSAAITETGDLYIWGHNQYGQLGDGTKEDRHVPIKVMEKVKSVSLGGNHSAAITETGDLYIWGHNQYGQLGDGTTKSKFNPVKIMEKVKSVSLGYDHSAAITKTGDLYIWGWNKLNQLGDGTTQNKINPVKIMENIKSVSLAFFNSAAITKAGDLYMWGGSVELGTGENKSIPIKIMEKVKSVSLGFFHKAIITETNDLYLWGGGEYGQLGYGGDQTQSSNIPIKVMENINNVNLGTNHSAAVTETGDLYLWGYAWYGQIGNEEIKCQTAPTKIMENIKLSCLNNISLYPSKLLFCSFGIEPKMVTELKKEATVTSYDNLTPNGNYIFCLLKSDITENLLAPENLLYIAQSTADSEGKLSFSYIPVDSETDSIAKLSEVGNYSTNNTSSIPGDVNGDGEVNIKDAVLLKKHLAGYTGLDINTKAADVNGDGEVNTKDAVRLLQYLAGYKVTLGK